MELCGLSHDENKSLGVTLVEDSHVSSLNYNLQLPAPHGVQEGHNLKGDRCLS